MKDQNIEPLVRSLAAYWRSATEIHHPNKVRRVSHEGFDYVVISSNAGVLAMYRLRNDGQLKRLRRLPGFIEHIDEDKPRNPRLRKRNIPGISRYAKDFSDRRATP